MIASVFNSTDVAAVIAALGSIAAAGVSLLNRRHIAQVHVLVNSQLSDVLGRLDAMTRSRNALQAEKDARNVHRLRTGTEDK